MTSNTNSGNRRSSLRFEGAFPVTLTSTMTGERIATARNVSMGGMLLELDAPLPVGTEIDVKFTMPQLKNTWRARASVTNHYVAGTKPATALKFLSVALV